MNELYTLDEICLRLRVSRRWLGGYLRTRPYYRIVGRRKMFTTEDLARLIGELPCPSNSTNARTRPIIGRGARTSASLYAEAQKLINGSSPSESSSSGNQKSNVV